MRGLGVFVWTTGDVIGLGSLCLLALLGLLYGAACFVASVQKRSRRWRGKP